MKYDIYIADYNKTKVLQLPIIPEELPPISRKISNEEFETYDNGTFNFIEKAGLTTLSFDSWLPMKKYNFARSVYLATDFIDLFNNAIDRVEPIRIVIINSNSQTYINDKFSIENFDYHMIKRGDYKYTLGLKQWREYSHGVYVYGWNQDATGWWYCTDVANYKYYTDGWQLIDNQWYYFNKEGYALQSTWLQYNGLWYYLKDNCIMAKSEWLKIGGIWYCFDANGALYVNTTTQDGYAVDANGALK
jgi:glucan-binding YG repeat protein